MSLKGLRALIIVLGICSFFGLFLSLLYTYGAEDD